MVIVDKTDAGKDPDDPIQANQPTIQRAIYSPGRARCRPRRCLPAEPYSFSRTTIMPSGSADLPGRYAVIGPGNGASTEATGSSITYLGFKSGENPGHITDPATDPDRIESQFRPVRNRQVAIYNDGTIDDLSKVTINPPVAVVVTPTTVGRWGWEWPAFFLGASERLGAGRRISQLRPRRQPNTLHSETDGYTDNGTPKSGTGPSTKSPRNC